MVALAAVPALAQCPQELVAQLHDVRRRLPEFQGWLTATGLAAKLEVLRVRCAPHPRTAPLYGVRLELRWISNRDTREAALSDFLAFDALFTEANGQSLRDRLFIKALHWSAAPSLSVSVHVHVLDTDLAAFLGAAGAIESQDGVLRMVVGRTELAQQVPGTAPRVARPASSPASTPRLPDGAALAKALEQHFGGRGRFRSLGTHSTFHRFAVERLRGEVTEGEHWERLEGTLLILQGPNAHQLMLHLDGRFAAAGLSDRMPDDNAFRDMEPQFTKRLDQYAQMLLDSVKSHLAENVK